MNWNYRIIKNKNDGYNIHEVYYDKDSLGCTLNPITLENFESKKDLIKTLEMMLADAKANRVLSYKLFEDKK